VFSGLLCGCLVTVGFLVTPTLFAILDDKQVAGMIAGEIFKNTSFVSLICSIFLLFYANILVKRGLENFKPIRWLLLLCICLTILGAFVIQPWMSELREIALNNGAPVMMSPQAKVFSQLHHVSSLLFTIEVFANFIIFWFASRGKTNDTVLG
jgi:cytochrome c biogenesis factor